MNQSEISKKKFDSYVAEISLNASPHMSDNCWRAIETCFFEKYTSPQIVKYLEWGSGNSTLAIIKYALESQQSIEITSIEHDPSFYKNMVQNLFTLVKQGSLTIESLYGPLFSPKDAFRRIQEVRQNEAYFLKFQYYTEHKNLFELNDHRDKHRITIKKIIKQSIKSLARDIHFYIYICKGLFRWISATPSLKKEKIGYCISKKVTTVNIENVTLKADVDTIIKNIKGPTKITLFVNSIKLSYLLFPHLKSPLDWRGRTFDGLCNEFPDYVLYPQKTQFDIVYVDGRARVSCLKRIKRENLLNKGGYLFVHDAFSIHFYEALTLFGPYTFIHGSNKKTDDQNTFEEKSPHLIQLGDSLDKLETRIDRELFVYHQKT